MNPLTTEYIVEFCKDLVPGSFCSIATIPKIDGIPFSRPRISGVFLGLVLYEAMYSIMVLAGEEHTMSASETFLVASKYPGRIRVCTEVYEIDAGSTHPETVELVARLEHIWFMSQKNTIKL